MTALYIIGGIAVFIAAILFSSIRLKITCDGELKAKLKFWFISVTLFPAKDKPKKKKKDTSEHTVNKNKKEKKPNPVKSMIENEGICDTVSYFTETVKELIDRIDYMASHLHITKLFLVIGVGDEDAAAAAIKCGGLNAVVYPFLSWVACRTKFKKHDVTIHPVYDGESYIKLDCRLRLRIIHGVIAAAKILWRLIKLNMKNKFINVNNTNKEGAVK